MADKINGVPALPASTTGEDFNYGAETKKDDAATFVADGDDADGEANLKAQSDEAVEVDVHTHLRDGVVRKMEQRHMQMIALAGVVGTGLFLGSGKAIAHGGPAGALLAYILIGTVTWAMLICLGEMAVFAPISGSYIHYAERWLHPSLGFALGWQFCLQYCISLPSEVVSASILVSYWDKNFTVAHQAAYMTVMCLFIISINLFGVRFFGESEFAFAMMKVFFIVVLIIAGLVVDLGGGPNGDRIGFRYWRDPGAFAPYHTAGSVGKFLGFFTDLVQAANSYGGIEMIGFAAAEVKNPRVAVSKAVRRLYWRILFFFVGSIFIVGMLVPYTDPSILQSTGTAASSPFVIAFQRAGIKVLPSFINAIVMLCALSSGNSLLYSVSRMIYGLCLRGQGPRFLAKTTKRGVPLPAMMVASLAFGLQYLTLSKGASTVLNWLQNLTALCSFICWTVIMFTYLRFKRGLAVQGIDRRKFHYWNRYQPYTAYWGIFWCLIIIVFNGWEVFTHGHWSGSNFAVDYISIPLFVVLALGYQIIRRPKTIPLAQLDFVSNIPTDEQVAYEEPPDQNWFVKACNWLLV